MPYKSAAQQHIETLQAELRERDRLLAEALSANATKAVEEANKQAEAARNEVIEKEKEKARHQSWRWFNFEQFAKERPNSPLDWAVIDTIPTTGWPSDAAESSWRDAHPAEAAVAAASSASVADTKLGRMLSEMEASRARIEAA